MGTGVDKNKMDRKFIIVDWVMETLQYITLFSYFCKKQLKFFHKEVKKKKKKLGFSILNQT